MHPCVELLLTEEIRSDWSWISQVGMIGAYVEAWYVTNCRATPDMKIIYYQDSLSDSTQA